MSQNANHRESKKNHEQENTKRSEKIRNLGTLGAGFVVLILAMLQIGRVATYGASSLAAIVLVLAAGGLIGFGSIFTIDQSLSGHEFGKK